MKIKEGMRVKLCNREQWNTGWVNAGTEGTITEINKPDKIFYVDFDGKKPQKKGFRYGFMLNLECSLPHNLEAV